MAKNELKHFSDDSKFEFTRGNFDDWLVRYHSPEQDVIKPTDEQMLTEVLHIIAEQTVDSFYEAFCLVYERTSKSIDESIYDLIENICEPFITKRKHYYRLGKTLLLYYLTMVSEENKVNTKLGKRIKWLSVHQILFDGFQPNQAASYSRGKQYYEVAKSCTERGF
ncbi:hypothetical protein OPS25_01345 [Alteromonas ponticola]|uniref:Uncharacterized protein n=1 Tax=Alteromonas aquimaris TaxID=2998417 RepID=A0ABT3P325_9ALTE|nr:hypothetical protein [Alteromonas aquimaris]MCW8107147.1 hypothetical protein [Alteromonas aquimaris]